jgi:glycosyltransferase involved in cell wall biosynthesis
MLKKKILFILPLPPPIHGASIVSLYIKQSLSINNDFNCRFINQNTSRSVDDIGKFSNYKLFNYLISFSKIVFYLISFQPNIVYLTLTTKGIGFYKDAFFALFIKLLGFKIIYHLHNKGVSCRQNFKFDNFLYKVAFKHSKVILLSNRLFPDVQKYISENQVYYCPNGIDYMLLNKLDKAHNIDNSKVKILFLSNLFKSKGVWDLLEACIHLKKRSINFKCVIVGGEGDISAVELEKKIYENNLQDIVYYKGKLYGDKKIAILQSSDIFIHPTYKDCFPLVLLEAMQFSLPIVTTNEGAIPDIVEDGQIGFIIPKNDSQTLANKLELLINDKSLRYKMGCAGRKKFENEFTIDHFEKKMLNILYQSCNNIEK